MGTIPKPKRQRKTAARDEDLRSVIHVRISEGLKVRLAAMADAERRNEADFVRILLEDGIKRRDKR